MESKSPGSRFRPDFGWACVGKGVELPYITRPPNDAMFIPVKLIDRLILRHYPSVYPKELSDKPPLICQFLNTDEATILSGICEQRYRIQNLVGTLDPIVNLPEFQVFFNIVQKTYPDVQIPLYPPPIQGPPGARSQGSASGTGAGQTMPKNPGASKDLGAHGWMLVKDAMIPFVSRGDVFLLPLNVLQGAAQLLVDVPVKTTTSTDAEITALNVLCKAANMTFVFTKDTALIDLATILAHHPGCPVRELPREDPLSGLVPGPAETAAAAAASSGLNSATAGTGGSGGGGAAECLVIPPALAAMYNLPPPPPLLPLEKVFPQQLFAESRRRQEQQHQQQQEQDEPGPRPGTTGDISPQIPSPGEVTDAMVNNMVNKDVTAEHIREFQARDVMFHPGPLGMIPGAFPFPPPFSQADLSFRPQPELVKILPIECFGKTISCITRGKLKTKYALVEAVCRVFFPDAHLVEFVNYLEHDLSVKLHSLKKIEEATFITFFGIPTDKLCCNLLIKLKDFVDRMAWLRDKFGGSFSEEVKSPSVVDTAHNDGKGDGLEGSGVAGEVQKLSVPMAPVQSFPNKRSLPPMTANLTGSPSLLPVEGDVGITTDPNSFASTSNTDEKQLRLAIKRLKYEQEQQRLQQLQQQQQQQLQAQMMRCNQLQVSN